MNKLLLTLTIDWEGDNFKQINDLLYLRKALKDLPLTHFICPNYFLSKKIVPTDIINNIILPQDEIALHVHCYRPLIEAAGLKFRNDLNYYKKDNYLQKTLRTWLPELMTYLKPISGRGNSLIIYSFEEQRKILSHARNLLNDYFPDKHISGFRAGGNLLNDHTFTALNELGFEYDASLTTPEVYSNNYSENSVGSKKDDYGYNAGEFRKQIIELYGGKIHHDGCFKNTEIMTALKNQIPKLGFQALTVKGLPEIPENVGMTDFSNPEKTAIPVLKKLLQKKEKSKDPLFLHYGCHLEGDFYYKKQLINFVEHLSMYMQEIETVTMQTAKNLIFPKM